jgi:hypothetical protein
LQRVAELLRGRDFGDTDVHRAAVTAAREVTGQVARRDIADAIGTASR